VFWELMVWSMFRSAGDNVMMLSVENFPHAAIWCEYLSCMQEWCTCGSQHQLRDKDGTANSWLCFYICVPKFLKRQFHQKRKIPSLFTNPYVVPNPKALFWCGLMRSDRSLWRLGSRETAEWNTWMNWSSTPL